MNCWKAGDRKATIIMTSKVIGNSMSSVDQPHPFRPKYVANKTKIPTLRIQHTNKAIED
jgi:hypothetical protein